MFFSSEASFRYLSRKQFFFKKILHRVFFWYVDGRIDTFFERARRKPDRYVILRSLPNCMGWYPLLNYVKNSYLFDEFVIELVAL